MFCNYSHDGVLLWLVLVTLSVTVKCVTVTTKVSEVFEVGKPATIECHIVYNEIEVIKSTTLYYMDTNGKLIKIGDHSIGVTINPIKDRANISIKFDKVKIMFNKLKFNDKFVFVCEGAGSKSWGSNPDIKNASIAIHNVQGGVKNCGKEISKPYALEEGTNLFDLTLCGNPQPKLFYTFQGKTEEAKMIQKLDDSKKMYKYKIEFEKIDRKVCGSTLEFKATGFKDWQASSIIQVNYKPDAVNPNQFQVIKESSRIENCTIFKMPPPANRECQHTHNIYAYDASKKAFQRFLNKSSIEVKICNIPDLFEKIEFAKVVAVWMTKRSDRMTDFVRVKTTNKIVPPSSERAQSDHDIVYLTDPLALVGISLVFVICVQSIVLVVYGCRYKRSRSQKKKRHSTHYEIDPLDLTDGEEDGSQSNNNRQNNSNYDYPYTHFNKTQQRHRSRGRNDTRDYDDIIPSSTFEEGVTLVTKSDDTAQYMEIADI